MEKHSEEKINSYYADFEKYVILTSAAAKELREQLHVEQGMICPILKKEFPQSEMTLDHKHKRKNDPVGPNGDGLCRGVIHTTANALEGRILKDFMRTGVSKYISAPEFLRNLANYLENPPMEQIYVHHTEKLKTPAMNKNDYNRIKKYWKFTHPKKALPKCPRNITKDMLIYLKETDEYIAKLENGEIKTLNQIDFKRILKYFPILYPKRKKLPVFPEHGIMNEELESLLNEVNLKHFGPAKANTVISDGVSNG